MQAKRWRMLSGLALVVALVCSSGEAAAQSGQPLGRSSDTPVDEAAALTLFWDQLSGLDNGAISVVATSPDIQSWGADDFPISAGTGYGVVRRVTVAAFKGLLGVNVTNKTVHVYFYDNAGGLPASNPRYTSPVLSPAGSNMANGDFYADLVAYLPRGGTYWVSVQVDMGSGDTNYWYWAEAAQQNLPSAWKGINDATCPIWNYRQQNCFRPPTDSKGRDLAFRLEGEYVASVNTIYLPVIRH